MGRYPQRYMILIIAQAHTAVGEEIPEAGATVAEGPGEAAKEAPTLVMATHSLPMVEIKTMPPLPRLNGTTAVLPLSQRCQTLASRSQAGPKAARPPILLPRLPLRLRAKEVPHPRMVHSSILPSLLP